MTVGHVPADAFIGHVLGGRYRVDSLIGRGGMANVYRATDEVLHRPVAVKLFGDTSDGEHQARRASTEVRLLAALNHPSLVTLYDARVAPGDDAFLVMELVDGPTLHERISDGPLSDVDIAAMALDLAEALHTVHDAGMVHRDIKPSNVLLAPSVSPTREFRAKLADFGIAHLVDSARLTMPGTIMGTAAYLSPEQTRGITPAPAGDIYSLGLVLLESFTRTRAFPGGMTESLVARVQRDPTIPGELGYAWKSLLTAMTSRSVEARPTALEVAASAREILRSEGTGPLVATETVSLARVSPAQGGVTNVAATVTKRIPDVGVSSPTPTEPMTHGAVPQPAAVRAAGVTLGVPARRLRRDRPGARRQVDRRRSRRRLLLVACAAVVTIGLGGGLAGLLTSGRAPVSASNTGGVGIATLSTAMDEFSTGITSFVDERKAAAAAASETTQTPDAIPATDATDAETTDTENDATDAGTDDETESPASDTSTPSGPEPGTDDNTPGGETGPGTDQTAPGNGNGNGKGQGNGNGNGNGNGADNGKGPGG